jgi:hypothetical protein
MAPSIAGDMHVTDTSPLKTEQGFVQQQGAGTLVKVDLKNDESDGC